MGSWQASCIVGDMKPILRSIVALGVLISAIAYAEDAPTAKALIDDATAKAAKSGKNVLVIFHASWCGWCHKFDDFLKVDDMGARMTKGLEIIHVTVMESPDHKKEENAGGEDLLTKLGGKGQGIPFMAILDDKGKMVVNSNPTFPDKPGNIGYPAAKEEIAHFIKMLEKGAPKITESDRKAIQEWLTKNAPK